jgi:5'-AMP-activated protein kinase catalytic alpha subunit
MYALKVIEKTKIVEEKLRECIKTEIQTMRLLRHPYVVKLFEVMTSTRGVILVMEYIKGCDFFDKIMDNEEKHLSEDESRLYFQQMLQALQYCHSLNIIHRDIKPQNILYDSDNNCIKIVDFGLSALLNEKDQKIRELGGTTSYLAPEIFSMSSGYNGQASDVWSIGVLLYNLCTGRK